MLFNLVNGIGKSTRLAAQAPLVKRHFWGWLNDVANRVDPSRIEEVGPDRAAAEWLLRCGAAVKWNNSNRFESDYNSLPAPSKDNSATGSSNRIVEIDGTNSTITSVGFPHFKGLNHLEKIVIKRNPYLDDPALAMLSMVKTLTHLELISIANITDEGVKSLVQLDKLKVLVLSDLPSVKSRDDCLSTLKSGLPKCDVDWPEVKANGN